MFTCKYLPHSELSTAYSVEQNGSQGPTEAPSLIMSFHAPGRLRQGRCRNSEHAQTINYNRPRRALYTFIYFFGKINSLEVHRLLLHRRRQTGPQRRAGAGGRLQAKVLLCRLSVSAPCPGLLILLHKKKKSSST